MGLTDSTVITPATHALSDEFDLAKAVAPAGQPVQPQPAQWDTEILSALAGSSTHPHDVDIDDEDWNLKGLSASSSDLMRFDVYVDDTGVFSPTEAVPDWELLAPKNPTEVRLAPDEPIGEEEADANLIEGDQEIKSDEPNLLEAQPDDEMLPDQEPVQTRSEVIGEIITPREIQGLVEHRQALPERKLPLLSGAFIGREREIRELRQLLADHQVVHLTGFTGVGKTRLALETANQLRSEFAGGVHYFYLPCVAQTALYSAVALHLMANPAAPSTGKDLLILDHADQTSRPSSIIAEILSARPELQIIVTSRDWMGISSAAELKVLPLEIPHIHPRKAPNWSSLLESAAMQLFIRATEQALPGYSLRESDAAGLGHLCGRSQGLPILIEILAAHLRVYPPPIILMQLDNRLRGLGAGQPAPSLQQSLNGVLGWSHNLLKRDEQLALAGLSLFVGGWNEESAAAVLGPLTHSPIGEILDQLAQKHFVQVVSTDGDSKRYTMSDAVRDFAATKLQQHELYLEILRAFAGAFWRMIENFKTDQKQWLAPVEAEIDNIRTVLHLAAENRAAEPLAQMTLGLWPLWEATERYDEADYWLSLALAQAEQQHQDVQNQLRLTSANIALRRGDHQRARKLLEECLVVYRLSGDHTNEKHVLSLLRQILIDHPDEQPNP